MTGCFFQINMNLDEIRTKLAASGDNRYWDVFETLRLIGQDTVKEGNGYALE